MPVLRGPGNPALVLDPSGPKALSQPDLHRPGLACHTPSELPAASMPWGSRHDAPTASSSPQLSPRPPHGMWNPRARQSHPPGSQGAEDAPSPSGPRPDFSGQPCKRVLMERQGGGRGGRGPCRTLSKSFDPKEKPGCLYRSFALRGGGAGRKIPRKRALECGRNAGGTPKQTRALISSQHIAFSPCLGSRRIEGGAFSALGAFCQAWTEVSLGGRQRRAHGQLSAGSFSGSPP